MVDRLRALPTTMPAAVRRVTNPVVQKWRSFEEGEHGWVVEEVGDNWRQIVGIGVTTVAMAQRYGIGHTAATVAAGAGAVAAFIAVTSFLDRKNIHGLSGLLDVAVPGRVRRRRERMAVRIAQGAKRVWEEDKTRFENYQENTARYHAEQVAAHARGEISDAEMADCEKRSGPAALARRREKWRNYTAPRGKVTAREDFAAGKISKRVHDIYMEAYSDVSEEQCQAFIEAREKAAGPKRPSAG